MTPDYGYRCDLCKTPTTSADDHVTTNGGEYLCLECFYEQEQAEDSILEEELA